MRRYGHFCGIIIIQHYVARFSQILAQDHRFCRGLFRARFFSGYHEQYLGACAPYARPPKLAHRWPNYLCLPRHALSFGAYRGLSLRLGVMVWCLSVWVYDHAPEAVRRTVLCGLLAWFVLDSSGSAASGNASNVLFNVLVLLLAVGPLWRPAKEA